jgi:hypothetical protein
LKAKAMTQLPRQVFHVHTGGVVVDDTTALGSDDDVHVGKILGDKLNELSLEERTHGIHDLHGVADIADETPEMLRTKLQEVGEIANSFSDDAATVAYRKVLMLMVNRDYVEKIKLMCLRADYYVSQKAAARLVSFFSYKQELFGDQRLAREITLEDFEGEDRLGLNNGVYQLLPQRDRAGRAVIMFVGKNASELSTETSVRTLPAAK